METDKIFASMAEAYRVLESHWVVATTDEKREMVAKARKLTTMNCGWPEYGAAQHILRRAKGEGA